MADAIAARLAEPMGPEVVLVTTLHSPSWFDQATMDSARESFFSTLRRADRYARLAVLTPVTATGRIIIVHAKLAIIDDELLRIGSANLNNRSTGFDTECDLVVQAAGSAEAQAVRSAIADYRLRLLAHWLRQPTSIVQTGLNLAGSVRGMIEALDRPDRRLLEPFRPKCLGVLETFLARNFVVDPVGSCDNWRPWIRELALAQRAMVAQAT